MIRFTVKNRPVSMSVKNASLSMRVEKTSITYIGGKPYEGEYEVTPSATEKQTLNTAQRLMSKDVVVHKIPYYETSNNSGGNTVFIGSEV